MLASPDLIDIVVKLGQANLFRSFRLGAHLVRGYADLGNEEFIIVGDRKLVSLYTGKPSSLPEGHEHFFYRVPTSQEITDVISRKYFDIVEVCYKEQREWHISAKNINDATQLQVRHREFECALALLLLEILEISKAE